MTIIKSIITGLDNLVMLKESVHLLENDPLIDEVIIINNDSKDGTKEWLQGQKNVTSITRPNNGAGPGRNTGLDLAGDFDYVLMLDMGIRPLIDGTQRLLEFLERRPNVDVLGVEIPHFETNREKAWRRWVKPITDTDTYQNLRLSQTAYCLARAKAFDGLRFCEEGPFGQPGWGADDDEMAYQWREAGIVVHAVTNVHPYRRGSGSFRRIFRETGIWPNQYASVYEQRLVWLQQKWPQYQPGVVWGEPWLTVVVKATDLDTTAKTVKHAHDRLRQRRFDPPYDRAWNPYSIIVWHNGGEDILTWAGHQSLRQHHGDATIVNGAIVKRNNGNEPTWTGDFRTWDGLDWRDAIRCNYYGQIKTVTDVDDLLNVYDKVYPHRPDNISPSVEPTKLDYGRHSDKGE